MKQTDYLIGISRRNAFTRFIKPPNPCLNYNTKYLKKLVLTADKENERILDIGSGGRKLAKKVINIDIDEFEDVIIVSDAGNLPLRSNSVDLVILTAVLEHVKCPDKIASEIFRVLKTNGRLYVESPFLYPFHADPIDFQRYTLKGLINLFSAFEVLDKGVCVGPFSAVAVFIRKFSTIFFKNDFLAKSIEFLIAWIIFWIKYFDLFLIKFQRLHVVAAGLYLLLQKKE